MNDKFMEEISGLTAICGCTNVSKKKMTQVGHGTGLKRLVQEIDGSYVRPVLTKNGHSRSFPLLSTRFFVLQF